MDINKVLGEYDAMFGRNTLEEIEAFLRTKIDEADNEGDYGSKLSLLSELMGFTRDTMQMEKGMTVCEDVVKLVTSLGLAGTVEYATVLLNVANAYRAFGCHAESNLLYERCENIYQEKLPANEFNHASLYNNWALLYQEMGDFENAAASLKKALAVVDTYPEAKVPQATTRSNLASTLMQMYSKEQDENRRSALYDEAMECLDFALKIHEELEGKDFHYSAALAAKGDACFLSGDYVQAAKLYKKAMAELEKHVGRNDNYMRLKANYEQAMGRCGGADGFPDNLDQGQACHEENEETWDGENCAKVFKNNLTRCQAFYEEYGAAWLCENFPDLEGKTTICMMGEGSDCFGFEDEISMDHDFGVGFILLLEDEDFAEYGSEMQVAYEKFLEEKLPEFLSKHGEALPTSFDKFFASRRGVKNINEFINHILWDGEQTDKWYYLPEHKLAIITNGRVFRDDPGRLTKLREEILGYYPDAIFEARLAETLHDFSQYAQSNYPRSMARKDYVTANICVARASEAAMKVAHLLNRKYAPYYKWLKRSTSELASLSEVADVLDEIALTPNQADAWNEVAYSAAKANYMDKIVVLFDKIAELILQEMKRQNIVDGDDIFLDKYVMDVAAGKGKKEKEMTRDELIEAIVKAEWDQFDKTKNEGGRADCQDDWYTFNIMRKSQYMTWPEALLASFLNDLQSAEAKGWNLIMEKYARMMETTAPKRYAELAPELPVRSEKRLAIAEEIIKIQVAWMEEFAASYPKLAGNARSIHTSEDNAYNTSYETYLRGELGTYSEETFIMYGQFVAGLAKEGKNLAKMIMENTAGLYGYSSVEEAEKSST